jgi:K+-transporting ATPase ATPase B chain
VSQKTVYIAPYIVGPPPEEEMSTALPRADAVVVRAGQLIPGDGEIIEGTAIVDESACCGVSAPVLREAGGERSAVTGGTRVTAGRIVVRIRVAPGRALLKQMIALVGRATQGHSGARK